MNVLLLVVPAQCSDRCWSDHAASVRHLPGLVLARIRRRGGTVNCLGANRPPQGNRRTKGRIAMARKGRIGWPCGVGRGERRIGSRRMPRPLSSTMPRSRMQLDFVVAGRGAAKIPARRAGSRRSPTQGRRQGLQCAHDLHRPRRHHRHRTAPPVGSNQIVYLAVPSSRAEAPRRPDDHCRAHRRPEGRAGPVRRSTSSPPANA